MKIYLLFIGGSGLRTARSFIHLCAAGCFNYTKCDFKAMLIDTDRTNGDAVLLMDTIRAYDKACENVHIFPRIDFYRENGAVAIWNPLAQNPDDSMKKIIYYDGWDGAAEGGKLQDLYDFLYTKDEQEISLGRGFYGHTSIGSYFMADAILGGGKKNLNPEWTKFFSDINKEDLIFVVGSMFGGTGASAIPTIAKILKVYDKTKDNDCGCSILMPYYETVADDTEIGSINSALFPAKNRAALYYYADQSIYDDYKHIYFVGEDRANFMKLENHNGGPEQRNKASYVEIESALTIADFINDIENAPSEDGGEAANIIKAYDVDYNGDNNPNAELINNIVVGRRYCTDIIAFFETAVLFNKGIYHIVKSRKGAGWVGRYKIDGGPNDDFRDYCKYYVDWMFEILTDTDKASGDYKNAEELLGSGSTARLAHQSSFNIINSEGDDKRRLYTPE
ncbi:MAG: hypothetical protein LUC97_03085, partial [Clostridiales bacterium]|nr:hypothetical protein [Clostridiales bacterium]